MCVVHEVRCVLCCQGDVGPRGSPGTDGATGVVGQTGPAGDKGARGSQGITVSIKNESWHILIP